MNKFIQDREFQIIRNNDFNLIHCNGLDSLFMILELVNEDFDFLPLISATQDLIFENQHVMDCIT